MESLLILKAKPICHCQTIARSNRSECSEVNTDKTLIDGREQKTLKALYSACSWCVWVSHQNTRQMVSLFSINPWSQLSPKSLKTFKNPRIQFWILVLLQGICIVITQQLKWAIFNELKATDFRDTFLYRHSKGLIPCCGASINSLCYSVGYSLVPGQTTCSPIHQFIHPSIHSPNLSSTHPSILHLPITHYCPPVRYYPSSIPRFVSNPVT